MMGGYVWRLAHVTPPHSWFQGGGRDDLAWHGVSVGTIKKEQLDNLQQNSSSALHCIALMLLDAAIMQWEWEFDMA